MITVNSTAQTALAVMKMLGSRPDEASLSSKTTQPKGVSPVPNARLSPSVTGFMANLSSYVQSQDMFGAKVQFSEMSADMRAQVDTFGGDKVMIREVEQLAQPEFEKAVLGWLKHAYRDDAGFQKALSEGTVKIQRGVDIADFGYSSHVYDSFLNGQHIGSGVTSTELNREWYDAQRANVNGQTYGSAAGQAYYASW